MRNMEIISFNTEEQTERACTTRELEPMLQRTDMIFLRYPDLGIGEMHLYLVTPGQ